MFVQDYARRGVQALDVDEPSMNSGFGNQRFDLLCQIDKLRVEASDVFTER